VLNPFIAELQSALGASPKPVLEGETICLRVSGRELTVDPWTTERLDPQARVNDALEADCRRVVTQSVALLAKCGGDLSALEGQDPQSTGGLYMARAEVMLDAAIGGSLVKDIQRVMDDLLKAGRHEEASGLSKFNHQLRHTVYELRKCIDPEYRSTIEELAEQLAETGAVDVPEKPATDAPPAPVPSRRATPQPDRSRPATPAPAPPLRRHGSARPAHAAAEAAATAGRLPSFDLPLRTKVLGAMLLVTAFILFLAILPVLFPARPAGEPPVSAASFPGLVRSVEDHWPGLYVTLETEAWDALDQAGRIELLHELSAGLTSRRYKGAFVRTPDGRPLGQWLWNNGVTLLDDGAEQWEPGTPPNFPTRTHPTPPAHPS